MANKTLFRNLLGKRLAAADTINEAGGAAYRFDPKHALAQFAATGCLNGTFYATAEAQLDKVLALVNRVDPEFIARAALYARRVGYMKDLPALLTASLSLRGPGLMAEVFDRVIDSPKMLRNYVQIMRSGVVGRRSLGTLPKRLVRQWIEKRTDAQLFAGSIGNDPSLADIIRMVHPKPATAQREALFGYLVGRDHDAAALPEIVKQFEKFKQAGNRRSIDVPDVPFQMLTGLDLSPREWKMIARNAPWQTTRMNLNTFLRHGVFQDRGMVRALAARLHDARKIAKARVFPYQLMAAYMNTSCDLPDLLRDALQAAMEIAIENVPAVDGKVYVFPDVSASMLSPVTGHRRGATTAVRCVDVAALVAAAMLRKNPDAEVIPFESDVVLSRKRRLNPRDSVMTNASKLASLAGGGTACSAPLRYLNRLGAQGDLVIYVSDNESWMDAPWQSHWGRCATRTAAEWARFKRRNPRAKMICIDIQPYDTTQVKERDDVINVAGFSDQVFRLIDAVARGGAKAGHWVRQIEAQTI
ncbi:MAG: RNA-binding protein [Phycisphaeraceae bacterium]|nr:RNA-binding protein [Phycisphaeraceae bacterium]